MNFRYKNVVFVFFSLFSDLPVFEQFAQSLAQRYSAYFPLSVQEKTTCPIEVGIASIFQNEAPYLKEWIEFHRSIGVAKFYLYNHLSTDEYLSVLQPYIEEGLVELIEWDFVTHSEKELVVQQRVVYNDAICRARNLVKWLALIDIDEFIVPSHHNSLPELLRRYDRYAAVAVSWQQYGTSDIQVLDPKQPMIKQLIRKAPQAWPGNWMIKSIVRPAAVVTCIDPHFCSFQQGMIQVNEAGTPFRGSIFPLPQIDHVRLNHYWTRDEHFMKTIKAKRKDGKAALLYEERKEILNTVEDQTITKFLHD